MSVFKKYTTREVCILAVLTAITAILAICCTFRVGNAVKIPTKFVSVFITGVFFGPVPAGLVAAIGDTLNTIFAPVGGWLPQLTVTEFLTGVLFGLFFHKKSLAGKSYIYRTICCVLAQAVLDMLIVTGILVSCGYFAGFAAAFWIRLPASIIKAVMQLAVLLAGMKYLPVFQRELKKSNFQNYANSFQAVSKLGLERISALLTELGNPQNSLRCIHIAGTNGKGSVAAFLQAILTKAGYKTGKYISPNMHKVNERISIDGADIGDAALSQFLDKLEQVSKTVEKKLGETPTQFEIWTAAAFAYFAAQKCDFVVLETGLGGRFDATNVISENVMSIITRIDMDHMEYLGNTIESIAAEKAGILKKDAPVITAVQKDGAAKVIENRAKALGCKVVTAPAPLPDEFSGIYEIYHKDGIRAKLSLGGVHQLENAAIAIAAAKELGVSDSIIAFGLSHAKNPGRFELLSENVVYDGAHNPDGVRALLTNLERYFPNRKRIYVMASMRDKDIRENLILLGNTGGCFRFVAVKNNPRSAPAEDLQQQALALGFPAEAYDSLDSALAPAEDALFIVCGSLYLYHDLDPKFFENTADF